MNDAKQIPDISSPILPGKHYLTDILGYIGIVSLSVNIDFFLLLISGLPPSVAAQVVHSAGRRFIVSPVPESRLRESFFGPPSASTSTGDELTGESFLLT